MAKKESYAYRYFGKFWVYLFLSILFIINITALSISLQCNKDGSMGMKVISAIFAFCFGLLYILLNYYGYRLMTLNKPCQFSSTEPFPF